ncbi:YdiU family protein [Bacillus sp. FJAT-42376]|uniref:protein adenylyltransferase SelO n=1 Tax=Bacillus sp. FJAT-42376 TaxID=2014076 RepID=UPI000F50C427|nr:YdiU family protein [Bacillus sp. FJAT-42376]AZB41773.1 YdiU family protein [Bacillus sp. FJAT-42376]
MEKESATSGWNLGSSYTSLPSSFYTKIEPNPVNRPEMVIFNRKLAASLGLEADELQTNAGILSGNELPEGAVPLAQAYAGHQFGNFTMLGDGRAMLIGEQMTSSGERVDIQLKGSGPTPYSRRGDGRAALGPMLREYIISEAMHGLQIPTTRSLAVVATGEPIYRETALPGAILTRTAASHLRVGTFQYAANWTSEEELRALADYAISRHYPEIKDDDNRYLSLLQKVMKRQAELISKWMLVGFIHGVMNTDNMTISGETIDYGPCAFIDTYDPETVFSSIDVQGRYAYVNQPGIGGWNLARFAESLLPLLHKEQEEAVNIAQDAISHYPELYKQEWYKGMRAKLGLFNEEKKDETLIQHLLTMMQKEKADYTNTFVALTFNRESALSANPDFAGWKARWQERLARQEESQEAVHQLMRNSNPAIIARNHRVEEALEAAANGDLTVMEKLLDVLANPYEHSEKQKTYAEPPGPECGPYATYCGT